MATAVTHDRALTAAVRSAAARYGIKYEFLSDQWVVRLEKAGVVQFLFAYSSNLNGHASGIIATDKVAVYQLLHRAGLPVVPHYLVRSLLDEAIDASIVQALFERYGELVMKPLRGGHGKHVSLHRSLATVAELDAIPTVETWAASPYVAIQREIRCVVLDGEVLLAHEKLEPVSQAGLPMFNLSHGAQVRDVALADLSGALANLAVQAMAAIGLRFGAVDIVELVDGQPGGRWLVLEINSGFALEHYAKSSPERRRAVIAVYERMIAALMDLE